MSVFSLLGLAANSICLFLLWRHRHEDINMSSVWECSRNDIASNLSVFVAAGAIWVSGSFWPDLIVAFGLVILLRSLGDPRYLVGLRGAANGKCVMRWLRASGTFAVNCPFSMRLSGFVLQIRPDYQDYH